MMVAEDIVHYLVQRCKDNFFNSSAFFEGILPSVQTIFRPSIPSEYCTVKNEILHKLHSIEESPQLIKSQWIYAVHSGGQAAYLDIAPALLHYTSVNILTHKLNEKFKDKCKFCYSIDGCQINKPEGQNITHLHLQVFDSAVDN